MSVVNITNLDVSKLGYGKFTVPKSGKGSYVNVTYRGADGKEAPIQLMFPLMFSWGASRDDREGVLGDKYKLSLGFPKKDDPMDTEEMRTVLANLAKLESQFKKDAVKNATKWGITGQGDDGEVTERDITMGHPLAGGAILRYTREKSTGPVKGKLIKNDPNKPPTLQIKLQQNFETKHFMCSIFGEDKQLLYRPPLSEDEVKKRVTVSEDVLNADVLSLLPRFGKVLCACSLTIWIQGNTLLPTLTLQQAITQIPANMRADYNSCVFGELSASDVAQLKEASSTIASISGEPIEVTAALEVEDSDDDEPVMPAVKSTRSSIPVAKAVGVTVPVATVPAAADDDEDESSEEEPVQQKKPIKRTVTKKR
jgi:hypothetical protein